VRVRHYKGLFFCVSVTIPFLHSSGYTLVGPSGEEYRARGRPGPNSGGRVARILPGRGRICISRLFGDVLTHRGI